MRGRQVASGRWLLAGNVITILLTLTLATGAYGVLMGTTERARLDVRGTVDASAVSAGYDILVRPKGSRSAAEESTGLVQPGFLSAVQGGISNNQWHQIEAQPGVRVAAPVAVVGWVVAYATVQVDLGTLANTDHPVVIRTKTTWSYDNGASVVKAAPSLLYLTPNPIRFQPPSLQPGGDPFSVVIETRPDGSEVTFRAPAPVTEKVDEQTPMFLALSTSNVAARAGARSSTIIDLPYPFPFLIAAVDPAREDQLTGVRQAMVSGSWLTPGEPRIRSFGLGSGGDNQAGRPVPVAVANQPYLQLNGSSAVDVFDGPEVAALAQQGYDGQLPPAFLGPADRTLPTLTADATSAYKRLLDSLPTSTEDGDAQTRTILRVTRTSPLRLTTTADGSLTAKGFPGFAVGWGYGTGLPGAQGSAIPPGGDDTAFRTMDGFFAAPDQAPPALVKAGVFDPARLPNARTLAALPLGTFSYSAPVGSDPSSAAALHDKPWYPSANVWGYTQPPPMMLTTLDALPAFSDPQLWSKAAPAGQVLSGSPPIQDNPISAVRVKVAGVTGMSELDRERVRSTAEAIATATGLDVDITMGASTGQQHVSVTEGLHGRPALNIDEPWVVKGVATRLVSGIDKASAALALAVLVASGLVVFDATFATTRARRRDIGIVSALGWRGRDIALGLLGPVLAAALIAGAIGALIAYVTHQTLGLPGQPGAVLVAIPASVGVALLAATGPAMAAARTSPTTAMKPSVSTDGAHWSPHVSGVTALALRALTSAPGRALAALLGAATATTVIALIRTVQTQFHNRAVGTVLGNAITVQVQAPDIAAAGLTALLAAIGIHHVAATEARERQREIGTLLATGWSPRTIARLLLTQAGLIALLGGLLGVGAALAAAHWILQADIATTLGACALALSLTVVLSIVTTAPITVRAARAAPISMLRDD